MDTYQQLIATSALVMGTAWASGINLYATIGVLGILGLSGNITLPDHSLVLQNPLVIGGLSSALHFPILFLILFLLFIIVAI